MSESPLLQSPRHRFMAFSAVGVAMVCLPLWQVLHYQQSDLHQLAAERALLDPVAKAVHVQFGLLAHRQVAAQLLRGQPQLEPTRQAVQHGVDEHLLALAQQLSQGLWSHALAESRDLKRDWQLLAPRVKAQALTAAQSDDAHALRIEQAVQVVDLITQVDTFSDLGDSNRSHSSVRFAQVVRQLSQLAADGPLLAQAQTTAAAPAAAEPLPAAQARLVSRLNSLQNLLGAAPGDTAAGSAAHPGAGPMALAMAEVSSTSHQLMRLFKQQPTPHSGGATADTGAAHRAQLRAAQQQAHRAQLALFNQALGLHKRILSQRQHTLQRQQLALWAALALLGATALALAAGLLRQTSRGAAQPLNPGPAGRVADTGAAAWNAPPVGTTASPTQAAAQQLFGRLRTERDAVKTDRHSHRSANQPEPENTLPPEPG